MSNSTFTVPIHDRYFEDYTAGSVHEFGPIEVQQDEMIAFAQRFDPQEFHINPEASKNSMYGGLIASGWFTSGLMMRLFVDNYLSTIASLGSPGVDNLKWMLPVRPDDQLSIRVKVEETKLSKSKPDRGLVHSFIEVLNQNRKVVMSMKAVNFLLCRG